MAPPSAPVRDRGPFTPATGLALALVGVFAFCALVVLSAYAPDLKRGDNGGAHALSKSAVGFAGLVEALKLSGDTVLVTRGPLAGGQGAGLLIVTPPPTASLDDVIGLGFGGPVLVVMPKWLAPPDPNHKGWVGQGAVIEPKWLPKSTLLGAADIRHANGVFRPLLRAADAPLPLGSVLGEGPVRQFQTIGYTGWRSVLTDQTGGVVLAHVPEHAVYVLSDPDLLDTQGLKSVETLGAALGLVRGLRRGDGPVVFDVRLNGLGRARSLTRLMFEPPLLGVTLCLAAAAALGGVQAACRFGPVRRPPPAFAIGKRALVDNTAALIRLARREHRMGGRYAELTRDLAARAVGAPRDLGGEALVEFLDRLAARRGAVDRLAVLTGTARAAPDRERLVVVAQSLFRWRQELMHGRG